MNAGIRTVLTSVCMGCVALISTGCNQSSNQDVLLLREENQARFNEIQAQLTILSEQLQSQPAAPMSPYPVDGVALRPSDRGISPGIEIVDIGRAQPEPARRQFDDLGQPFPRGQTAPRTAPQRTAARGSGARHTNLAAQHVRVSGLSVRDVQTALKNAGVDPGPVDGKMGQKTIAAIRQFQRNNPPLKADGIVGSQTWDRLRPHLTGRGGGF